MKYEYLLEVPGRKRNAFYPICARDVRHAIDRSYRILKRRRQWKTAQLEACESNLELMSRCHLGVERNRQAVAAWSRESVNGGYIRRTMLPESRPDGMEEWYTDDPLSKFRCKRVLRFFDNNKIMPDAHDCVGIATCDDDEMAHRCDLIMEAYGYRDGRVDFELTKPVGDELKLRPFISISGNDRFVNAFYDSRHEEFNEEVNV